MAVSRFPVAVPERIPRLVAAQVVVLGVLPPLVNHWWPLALLVVDFAVRALVTPRLSPLAAVGRNIAWRLPGGPGDLIAYAPKRFAATLGLVFFGAALVLHLFPGTVVVGQALAAMVVVLASLEAFLGYCVGCQIHALLVKTGLLKAPACPTCFVPRPAQNS